MSSGCRQQREAGFMSNRKRKKNETRPRNTLARLKKTSDPIKDYADNVLAGRIVACRWVKLACQRHLDDLTRSDLFWALYVCIECRADKTKSFTRKDPCPHSALYAIGFFRDVLCLNGGEFEGKPFVLDNFQAFIVGSLFGWRLPNNSRRFRRAYIEIAKGNGKSPLAAGMGMFGLIADDEARAEIYAAATKKDQAMILFRDAVAMRDQSPRLKACLQKSGVGEKGWNLAYHKTGSWFRPISSDEDSQSGPRPHFALVDEIHEHKTPVVIQMLDRGFKNRRNPLMVMTTNSGTSQDSVCWYYHDYGTQILKQTKANDRYFIFICALDSCDAHWTDGKEQPVDNCKDCDDWRVEGPHWKKANPGIDTIGLRQKIRDNVHTAIDMPTEENSVRRLNFCQWTSQTTRWLSMDAWDSCNKPVDFPALKDRSCIVGLDLSLDKDITALVLLFPPDHIPVQQAAPEKPEQPKEPEVEKPINFMFIDFAALTQDFIVVPYLFMPKDTMREAERRDRVPYSTWERQGYLYATEGNTVDYGAVRQKLISLQEIYPIKKHYDQKTHTTYHLIGFDPWNARDFSNSMQTGFGINMIEVRQGYQTLSEPTKQLARLLKAGKVRHGGHPVLRYMADNVIIKTDPNKNIMIDKVKATKHIDGISALINAFTLAIRIMVNSGTSIYEERARAGDGPIVRTV